MPVILEPDDWPVWLSEEAGEPAELLRPAPLGTRRLWPGSRVVNSVRNDGPELLVRAADWAGFGTEHPRQRFPIDESIHTDTGAVRESDLN